MRKKVAVTVLVVLLLIVLLLLVGVVPLTAGHQMKSCPECLSASLLGGMGLCLAVLGAAIVLVTLGVEWLPGRSHPQSRLLLATRLERPPRST